MTAMPGIEREILIQAHLAEHGMNELAIPIGIAHQAQQAHPAIVQGIEQGERNFDGSIAHVGQLGPFAFGVRFDGGFVFCKRQLEADVGVHVAFGNMMNHLASGPAAGAIGRVELGGRERKCGFAKKARRFSNLRNPLAAVGGGDRLGEREFSNGVLKVGHGSWMRMDLQEIHQETVNCRGFRAKAVAAGLQYLSISLGMAIVTNVYTKLARHPESAFWHRPSLVTKELLPQNQ